MQKTIFLLVLGMVTELFMAFITPVQFVFLWRSNYALMTVLFLFFIIKFREEQ